MAHILVRPDNGVSILICPPEIDALQEASKIAILNDWKYVGEYPTPSDYFRNCWMWDETSKSIVVDLEHAKLQKLEEIRYKRNKRLEETDPLMTRANEIGTEEEKDKLKAYRQELRNLPNIVSKLLKNLTTVSEIENFNVNDILNRPL